MGAESTSSREKPWFRRFAVVLTALAVLAAAGPARAQDGEQRSAGAAEVFGGFSYLDFDGGGLEDFDTGVDGFGLQAEVTYFFREGFGISFEFGRHTGDLDIPVIAIVPTPRLDFSQTTWMVGPRFRFGGNGRVAPSLRLLAGVAKGSVEFDFLEALTFGGFSVEDDVFAGAIGGALDVALAESLAWRIVQPDLMLTTYAGDAQVSLRVTTGIVVRF